MRHVGLSEVVDTPAVSSTSWSRVVVMRFPVEIGRKEMVNSNFGDDDSCFRRVGGTSNTTIHPCQVRFLVPKVIATPVTTNDTTSIFGRLVPLLHDHFGTPD